jgi:hypothetical protein
MKNDEALSFGKYEGKTPLEVVDIDPCYIIWLCENSIVEVSSDLLNYAINATMEPDFEDLDNDCEFNI